MPMRSELSISAVHTGWKARGIEFSGRLFCESLMNPDVLLSIVLAVLGLLLAVSLTILFPFPDDIARSPNEMETPMEIVVMMLVLGALPIVAAVLLDDAPAGRR